MGRIGVAREPFRLEIQVGGEGVVRSKSEREENGDVRG